VRLCAAAARAAEAALGRAGSAGAVRGALIGSASIAADHHADRLAIALRLGLAIRQPAARTRRAAAIGTECAQGSPEEVGTPPAWTHARFAAGEGPSRPGGGVLDASMVFTGLIDGSGHSYDVAAMARIYSESRTSRREDPMTDNDGRASNTPAAGSRSALRRRGETSLRGKAVPSAAELEDLPPEETLRRLQELRVLQTELGMQNDELRRMQQELDAARVRYFDLYDMAPVGYCTTSQQGVILQANFAAATLLGVARGALVNQPISRFIFPADQDIFHLLQEHLAETGGRQVCELRMLRKGGAPLRVHLVASVAHEADDTPHLRIVLVDLPEPERA